MEAQPGRYGSKALGQPLQSSGTPDGAADDADPPGGPFVAVLLGIEGLEHHPGRVGVGHLLDPLGDESHAVPDDEGAGWRRHRRSCAGRGWEQPAGNPVRTEQARTTGCIPVCCGTPDPAGGVHPAWEHHLSLVKLVFDSFVGSGGFWARKTQ